MPEQSPFAPDRLSWRLYRLLDAGDWQGPGHERLARYLDRADPAMRHALAVRIAEVFDHYLSYRPEYLERWQRGESLFVGEDLRASELHRADERWQAALWRRVLEDLAIRSASRSSRSASCASRASSTRIPCGPSGPRVSRCSRRPAIAPLHAALLREFGRWIDVDLYLLNPCREFWHDIVTERQAGRLEAAGKADYQEVGIRCSPNGGARRRRCCISSTR
ncbi:MAG: exodeoxyribonuclease V subunit gamma [Pararobbsia sp.]